MESKYLRSFLTIADCQSFSKAESKLFISKQGLKKQIDVLEQELRVELFERTQKGLRLTPAGDLFYEYAKNTSQEEEKIICQLRELAQRSNSIVVLNHQNPRTWLEESYSQFAALYPGIQLKLEYILPSTPDDKALFLPEAIMERVLSGSVDVALHVIYKGDSIPPSLGYMKVIRQEAHCLMMPGHPLSSCEKISLEQLSGFHIAFTQRRSDSSFAMTLRDACPDHEVCPIYINNIPKIFSVCYNGGIWITKAYYANYLPPLVSIPLDFDCGSISGLLYRQNHTPAVDKFLAVVRDTCVNKAAVI